MLKIAHLTELGFHGNTFKVEIEKIILLLVYSHIHKL